jgi:hypothetical protein
MTQDIRKIQIAVFISALSILLIIITALSLDMKIASFLSISLIILSTNIIFYWIDRASDKNPLINFISTTIMISTVISTVLFVVIRIWISLPNYSLTQDPLTTGSDFVDRIISPLIVVVSLITCWHFVFTYPSNESAENSNEDALSFNNTPIVVSIISLFPVCICGSFMFRYVLAIMTNNVFPPLNTLSNFRFFLFWYLIFFNLFIGILNIFLFSFIKDNKKTRGVEKYFTGIAYIFAIVLITYARITSNDYYHDNQGDLIYNIIELTAISISTITVSIYLNNDDKFKSGFILPPIILSLIFLFLYVLTERFISYSLPIAGAILEKSNGLFVTVTVSSLTSVGLVLALSRFHIIGPKEINMSKIEVKLGDGTVITGDFVVANSITESFNRVESAEAPNELKELLKRLVSETGKMSSHLPKETAQQVAQDLSTLTSEAVNKNPRRRWWELSIEGLTQAAKDIGEIGKPVLEILALIVPLLAAKTP